MLTAALLFILVAVAAAIGVHASHDGSAPALVVFDEKAGFSLQYRVVVLAASPYIECEFRVLASGADWIGFGISESGHMLGADMLVVEFNNDQATLPPRVRDMFVPWAAYPDISPVPEDDTCNDWELISFTEQQHEEERIRTVLLRRRLNTTDSQDRVMFAAGSSQTIAIYAWGRGQFGFHGPNRGTVLLAASPPDDAPPPSTSSSTTTLTVNHYELLPQHTMYVTQLFDLGSQASHVLAYNALVLPEHLPLVHHFLLHDCGHDRTRSPVAQLELGKPVLVDESPMGRGACKSLIVAWAKGGGLGRFTFPNDTGYELGSTSARYVILELHLDNPELLAGGIKINSGLQLHRTTKRPKHNVGCLVLGDAAIQFPDIPAHRARTTYASTCPAECTSQFRGAITVFQTMPHMHNFGRELWTTLERQDQDNRDDGVLEAKQYWNFGFQTTTLSNFTVRPGDRLDTYCTYDTSKVVAGGKPINFGLTSAEEMCMNFFFYYPRENAGFTCGFMSPSTSLCGTREMLHWNGNPTRTRERFPKSRAVGKRPASRAQCLVKRQRRRKHVVGGGVDEQASGGEWLLLAAPAMFTLLMLSSCWGKWWCGGDRGVDGVAPAIGEGQ